MALDKQPDLERLLEFILAVIGRTRRKRIRHGDFDFLRAERIEAGGRAADRFHIGVDLGVLVDHLGRADRQRIEQAADARCAEADGFLRGGHARCGHGRGNRNCCHGGFQHRVSSLLTFMMGTAGLICIFRSLRRVGPGRCG